MAENEKDQFLKTLGKRISDTDMMKDVCLAMGMKSHQIESHLTNYPQKINEAAFEAFLTWWTENTANNKSERELLTTIKTAFKEGGIERRWIDAMSQTRNAAYKKHENWCKTVMESRGNDSVDGIDVNGGGDAPGTSSQLTLGIEASNSSAELNGAASGISSGQEPNIVDMSKYNAFDEVLTLPLQSKVKIIGRVKGVENKITKRIREIQLVNSEMKELKVTVFGNVPQRDRQGLRKGRVLEVSGIILESGARYVCVSYDKKGSMIRVLPKDNELSKHFLSTVGKKRKSVSNISRPTETRTIKYLKDNRSSELFEIQNCIITQARAITYHGCKSCKTKKTGEKCTNPRCKSKSKKKEKILAINVTLEDETVRGEGVEAVMFGDVCTSVMGMTPKKFMEKTGDEQRLLCKNKCVGRDFSVDIITGHKSWVIKRIQLCKPLRVS